MTEVPEGYKRCPTCGEVKPVGEFNKNKNRKGGLQYECKTCRKNYREENRETAREYSKKYYKKNKEKVRNYREENIEKMHEKDNKYYRCVKNPTCPAVGKHGAEFVIMSCPICGKEFRMLKNRVDYLYETRGQTRFCCSRDCGYESMRKARQTEYEKNIKRIRKEQRG